MDVMSREEFEAAVDDALDSLPLDVVTQIADSNTVILVEEEPEGDEELLGVFDGVPLTERGHFDGLMERAASSCFAARSRAWLQVARSSRSKSA